MHQRDCPYSFPGSFSLLSSGRKPSNCPYTSGPQRSIMGGRTQRRVKTVLPIRLGGIDSTGKPFMAMAHTIDISHSGARVGGVVAMLTRGGAVELQYRHRKAKFEISWIRSGGNEQQLGLRALEPLKEIWGASLDTSDFQDDYEAPKKPA